MSWAELSEGTDIPVEKIEDALYESYDNLRDAKGIRIPIKGVPVFFNPEHVVSVTICDPVKD
jgi:hypothetical protein